MTNRPPSTETTFATKDYFLAGALIASGNYLSRLDWENGEAFFIFEDRPDCERLEQGYWSGDLTVSARKYSDGLRLLKGRLYGHAKH